VKSKTMLVLSLVLLVLGLISVVLVAGCGSSADETTTTAATTATTAAPAGETTTSAAGTGTTAAPATFDGEIVLGGICSLTGVGAMTGAEQKWAQEKAIADINAKGGVNVGGKKMELKLKLIDDKSDAVEASAAMEKLIKVEGLKLILGTQVSPLNMAAALIAEKYQVFFNITTTFTNWVRDKKFKWTSDLFWTPDASGEVPFLQVELMPQAERPTRWGMLTEDNQDGQAMAGGVKVMAENHKVELVAVETFSPGAKDYSSAILKFREAKVDALLCFVSPADGITFTKQMKEQGFSPKYMMGWKGFWPTEFMKALGPDSDYICHDGFWSEDLPYPGAKELGQAYRADHDGIDSVSIGLMYAAVQVMATAIERAGSTDPAAVRDQVFNGKFLGTTEGDVQYDALGCADIPPVGLQWLNQKRVVVFPANVANGKMEWFVAWDKR
jgi:branched-chain amino acid transport system substrate-binding protein